MDRTYNQTGLRGLPLTENGKKVRRGPSLYKGQQAATYTTELA